MLLKISCAHLVAVCTLFPQVEEFRPYIPLIAALRSSGMRDRHWDDLSAELRVRVKPDPSFTLATVSRLNLLARLDVVQKVRVHVRV